MPKRKDGSRDRTGPLARPALPPADAVLRGLEQIIEAERGQLLQAHSVIRCVYELLLYADGENALYHADAANLAAQLIDGVAERLDAVNLRARLEEMCGEVQVYADLSTARHDVEGVREASWPEPGGHLRH